MIQQIYWIVYKPIKMSVGDGGIEKEIYKKSRIIKSFETSLIIKFSCFQY